MARPKPLTEDQRLLWKAHRDLYQELSGALQEQLHGDTALSGSEYAVLAALSHSPDGVLRARELGAELGWDRSRLSHLVRRMENRRLVTREECWEDARGSMVRLTDDGAVAAEDAAPEHSEAIRRYFFNPLSKEQLATLAVVFDRLLDNLARNKK